METKYKMVFQTISLFMVLAILTLILVFGFNFLFYGVDISPAIPASK